MRGKLITFEGIEGSGKSTQANRLATYLRSRGRRVSVTREPGGVKLGEAIRTVLLDPGYRGRLCPESELLLYEAARAQHVAENIIPSLARGAWVICDRFYDASTAYQGHGRGLDLRFVHEANRFASKDLVPDRTFLLDLPAEEGLERARSRSGHPDRLEREALAFHRSVRRGYLTVARAERRRFTVLDARRPQTEVFASVLAALGLGRG